MGAAAIAARILLVAHTEGTVFLPYFVLSLSASTTLGSSVTLARTVKKRRAILREFEQSVSHAALSLRESPAGAGLELKTSSRRHPPTQSR